ncbi:hypothetical protein ETN89_19760 (plasmid) [Photobacterium damselae subsp. damselae]|uniref:hypothetical protein n=1 Tax=Photobacterium damselae TaxID=38293 RepID=UPI0010135B9F|nr:hypothetical protein [Photobacterium damselae]QAY37505.1 hypothetical protein ETN89_19760 [Photobacterium damselae subsp. damselae]
MTYSNVNHATISNQLEATSVSPLEQSGKNKNEISKSKSKSKKRVAKVSKDMCQRSLKFDPLFN